MKPTHCKCGEAITQLRPSGSARLFCDGCRKAKKAVLMAKWFESKRQKNRAWREENKKRASAWRKKNAAHIKAYRDAYYSGTVTVRSVATGTVSA